MSIEQFAEKVKNRVSEEVKEEVLVGTVTKNNGIILHSLMIKRAGKSLHPTIYLEHFFKAYNAGKELEEIVKEIIEFEKATEIDNERDNAMSWYCNFEKVKDSIVYRLVNTEKNKEVLESVPHQQFLDLSKVYYVEVDMQKMGKGSIKICNNHLAIWGITEKELMEIAEKNTEAEKPGEIKEMQEIILEIVRKKNTDFLKELEEEEAMDKMFADAIPMYVATNAECLYGANVMCYQGFFKSFAEEQRSDMYILPSSVHEVILIPANRIEEEQSETLKSLVREVNETGILEEEILSDNVYYYDRVADKITVL